MRIDFRPLPRRTSGGTLIYQNISDLAVSARFSWRDSFSVGAGDDISPAGEDRLLTRYTIITCNNLDPSLGAPNTYDLTTALLTDGPAGSFCESGVPTDTIAGTECTHNNLTASGDVNILLCEEVECKLDPSLSISLPNRFWITGSSSVTSVDTDGNTVEDMGTWWVAAGPAEFGFTADVVSLLLDFVSDPPQPQFWAGCFFFGGNPFAGMFASVYADPVGACCIPQNGGPISMCTINSESSCQLVGGTFRGISTNCDNDGDGDGVPTVCDNCFATPNPSQSDCNNDGIGDACENNPSNQDDDGDGSCNGLDICPKDPQNDSDGDGICGDIDVCPHDPDNDKDGDGVCGDVDICPNDPSCGDALVTIDCSPVGATDLTGSDMVEVECILTANKTTTLQAYQLDLPCSLPGRPGSSGSINSVGITVDVLHTNPPFLFSVGDFVGSNQIQCQALGFTFSNSPVTLEPGDQVYLATITYEVDECAGGDFDVLLENLSDPPTLEDQTKLRPPPPISGVWPPCPNGDADCAPGIRCSGDIDPVCGFISFNRRIAPVRVVTGTCCDGSSCLVDDINAVCCQNAHPGARFDAGNTCADPIPCGCGNCQLYGDVFPAGTQSGNCVVDIDDILVVVTGFSDADPCANNPQADLTACGGPCRIIDLDDILLALAAFANVNLCDHPCAPGACCFDDGSCADADASSPGATPAGGMSYSDCVALGGVYVGDNTICLGDGDSNGVDDICP